MLYALVLAGGAGTRLWPHSRSDRPKQFTSLAGGRSMLQQACDRLAPLVPAERVLVGTGREFAALVASQLPDLPAANILGEPCGRGTAAAIGLAALHLAEREADAVMAVVTADHVIGDPVAFRAGLEAAASLAGEGWLVTLGIRPSRPDTGFGYLQRGDSICRTGGHDAYEVARFVEKPDHATAEAYLLGGIHDWNSGMFIWRADRILAEIERSMPDLFAGLLAIGAGLREACPDQVLDAVWTSLPNQTIDYGVMERAERVAVLPVHIGWSDVGTWQALYEILPRDADDNAILGSHAGLDTTGSLVIANGRLIATIGVSDLVIVDADDVLLVCPRDRVQEVKQLVAGLAERGMAGYLASRASMSPL